MKTAIIDDSIEDDWVNRLGLPTSTLLEIVNILKSKSFSAAIDGRSLMEHPPATHNFDFLPIQAREILDAHDRIKATFDHSSYNTFLIDYSLKGHSDSTGKEVATQLVKKGVQSWRILLVSRHQGQELDGDFLNEILNRKKTETAKIAEWLIKRLNAPERNQVASAVVYLHTVRESNRDHTRLPIVAIFHSSKVQLPLTRDPIEAFQEDLRAFEVAECQEVEVLAGDTGRDLVGVRSMLVEGRQPPDNWLNSCFFPAQGQTMSTWTNLVEKLDVKDAPLDVAQISNANLLDWAFPRLQLQDRPHLLCGKLLKGAWAAAEQCVKFGDAVPTWISGPITTGNAVKNRLPFHCYLDFCKEAFLVNAVRGGVNARWNVSICERNSAPHHALLVIECVGSKFESCRTLYNAVDLQFEVLRRYCHVLVAAHPADSGLCVAELLPDKPVRPIASTVINYHDVVVDFKAASEAGNTVSYVIISEANV